jgi:DNA-directed RNA polymerase subunit L
MAKKSVKKSTKSEPIEDEIPEDLAEEIVDVIDEPKADLSKKEENEDFEEDDEFLEDIVDDEEEKMSQIKEEDSGKSLESNEQPIIPKKIIPRKQSAPMVLTKDDIADKLSEQLEQDITQKEYKHLDIAIEEIETNNYVVHVLHQAHGFLSYVLSKILKIKGVIFAAYKLTSLEPAKINIRLDGTKDIKSVLKEASKMMKIELKGVGNAIASVKM